MNKKTLKFYADAIYNGQKVYAKGEVVDVPSDDGYADRWIKRGIAEEIEPEKKFQSSGNESRTAHTKSRKSKHIENKNEDEQTVVGLDPL